MSLFECHSHSTDVCVRYAKHGVRVADRHHTLIPVPFSSSRLVEAVFSMLGTSEVNEPQERALFVSTRPREVQPQLDQLRACGTDVELLDNTTHLLKSVEDLQPHVIVLDEAVWKRIFADSAIGTPLRSRS